MTGAAATRAVLLDVEGTTTPLRFVHDVLFPHARERLGPFLHGPWGRDKLLDEVSALRREHDADAAAGAEPPDWWDDDETAWLASAERYARWLMDRDRKSTPLKSIQGKIWERGYATGELKGLVYPDVAPAFERWHRAGVAIAIFSSGSVLAQRLLFAHTSAGDLTPHIAAYFDTTTGAKGDPESYRRIAAGLRLPAAEMLFLSDTIVECAAAHDAGMQAALCVREKAASIQQGLVVRTFDEVLP